jgi:hypothetical protein
MLRDSDQAVLKGQRRLQISSGRRNFSDAAQVKMVWTAPSSVAAGCVMALDGFNGGFRAVSIIIGRSRRWISRNWADALATGDIGAPPLRPRANCPASAPAASFQITARSARWLKDALVIVITVSIPGSTGRDRSLNGDAFNPWHSRQADVLNKDTLST